MRHQYWMSSVAYATNLALLVSLPSHADALSWLPAMLLCYLVGSLTISVGFHRLFCHQAFKASAGWHWFFAIFGVLAMYGSPLQWAVTHSAHHKYSDTDRDPHPTPWTWKALLTKSYRPVPLDIYRARRLLRQHPLLHRFVDGAYVEIYLVLMGVLLWTAPDFVALALLPGLGLVQFIGSLHNTISHKDGRARDLWWMEYLLPAAGEWLHGLHHRKPRLSDFRTRWYHLDTGALLVRLIRK